MMELTRLRCSRYRSFPSKHATRKAVSLASKCFSDSSEGAHVQVGGGGEEACMRRGVCFFAAMSTESVVASAYSRKNPFPARLNVNRKLSREGSEKDTRHFELELEGSGLVYECGDSIGIFPKNDPELVQEILHALGCDGRGTGAGK